MFQQHRLTVAVAAEASDEVHRWLSQHCDDYAVHPRQAFQLCLGAVEAVNNLIQHSTEVHDTHFHIHVLFTLSTVEIEIIHRAPPFRIPRSEHAIATDSSLLRESGRGWLILRQWFSSIDYQVEAGVNRLRLIKRTAACAFDHHYPFAF